MLRVLTRRFPVAQINCTRSMSSAHQDIVQIEQKGNGVVFVRLNDPRRRNCLSSAMIKTLQEHLGTLSTDPGCRVIVLAGNGPAFSSGHDLKEMRGKMGDDAWMQSAFQECSMLMQQIHKIPQPVIAAVDGLAVAAGCQLACACDMIFASEKSTFQTPGVNIGLFCHTPAVEVVRSVGQKMAMEMLLTGEPISAERALKRGMLNEVLPSSDLESRVIEIAQKISSKPFDVVLMGKEVFNKQVTMVRDGAYEVATEAMCTNMKEENASEGISAFLEKRHPVWVKQKL